MATGEFAADIGGRSQVTAGTLAKVAESLNRRHRRLHGGDLPHLLMLTDEQRVPDPLADLDALPPRGAVILRHYGLPSTERKALAVALRAATRERRQLLLVAEDASLAAAVGADGLHLPERALMRFGAAAKGAPLMTAAAHSPVAIRRAAQMGADAVLLSPIFETVSHPGRPGIGVIRAALWLRHAPLPVYALGGIAPDTAPLLLPFPFAGLAAVGAFTR